MSCLTVGVVPRPDVSAPPELRTITFTLSAREVTVSDKEDARRFVVVADSDREGSVVESGLVFGSVGVFWLSDPVDAGWAFDSVDVEPADPVTSSAQATPGDVTTAPQMPIVKAQGARRAKCFASMLRAEYFRNRLRVLLTP